MVSGDYLAARATVLVLSVVGAIRKRASGDRGESFIDAILILIAGGFMLWVAFKVISLMVSSQMGGGSGGGSGTCDLPVKSEC